MTPVWGKAQERTSAKPHDVAAAPHPARERSRARTHDVSAPPPPILSWKGVERGHMMCLPHLHWIITFNGTVESTYTEDNATESGKLVRERQSARPHDVAGAPLTDMWAWRVWILTVFSTGLPWGPGIVGPDAKAIGPRLAQHLSGLRGAQHDACSHPRDARQNKKAHTTSRTSRQFIQ